MLVVIDTLRQDRVSAYGEYSRQLTPALDRLAEAGAIADGLAPSSWTRPSAATIFTGLGPLRHQVAIKTDRIPETLPTLTELLRSRGFSTLGITTNGHVSSAWGFDRGFDELIATWREGLGHDTPALRVNDALEPRLDRLRPPFFLYVHYLDPHQPYGPPAAWDGGPLPESLTALAPLGEGALLKGDGGTAPEVLAAATDLYDGEVRVSDAAVADLLARLAARGLDEGTLVVVTSDHGEELAEHGRVGHGKSLYDEVLRVPLIFHAPGVIQAGRRLGSFPLESLVPTLLDLVGGRNREQALPEFDGPSFAAALVGSAPPPDPGPRLLYLEGNPDAGLGLRDGSWKLLLHLYPYRKELFDLRADPGERQDRFGARAEFERLASELAARYGEALRSSYPRWSTTADAELSAQLAALGYGGASKPEFARRVFPRRLRPAEPRAGGLRGWEDVDAFRACGDALEDPARQLLAGWYGPQPGEPGRWSEPVATLGVARPPGDAEGYKLVLEGVSWRPQPARMTIRVEEGPLVERSIRPGPFRVEIDLPAASAAPPWALVRLEVAPPFRPSEQGLPDERVLGLFFTHYCLESAPGS